MDTIYPGHFLAALIVLLLVVLALRLQDETTSTRRNHIVICGGALMAFGLVVRLIDVLTHIEHVRWSAVIGAIGVLAFLASDQRIARRYGRAWTYLAGDDSPYTGPERRRFRGHPDREATRK
jgi:hypothetical protein